MTGFAIDFEEDLPGFVIPGSGFATFVEAATPGSTPAPARSIRNDQAWRVDVTFQTGGPMSCLIEGSWDITVYLEGYGAQAPELQKCINVPFNRGNPGTQGATLNWAAGEVPAGAYRTAVTVTMRSPSGCPVACAGVGDSALLQFYDGGQGCC